ncbi:hypothetical protein ACTHAM_003163 [Cellulomonas soli]|uniref:hypothetical protein n=1 Tax=Cellulomonas soli TaxID=931535 RepID=UPI003F8343C7
MVEHGWVAGAVGAWRVPGWRRRFAVWAMLGAIGDGVTTSVLPHLGGLVEVNPVSAAGQAWVGSVPVYMVLVTVPLVALLSLLALRPRSAHSRVLWFALALCGVLKIGVTVWNVLAIQSALTVSVVDVV